MKTLFIGGIKSGKSINAQGYILKNSDTKPTYLATTEFIDAGMRERIDEHKKNRGDDFIAIEEPLKIYEAITANNNPVLVECVSMWINNMLYHGFDFEDMKKELTKILDLEQTVVFVLNDVGSGVIPNNKLAREFVDISGKLSQLIASKSDEVYHTIAGISTRIK
ncbi:MAG: bifunctional adenosylcobinamide kinase/adenosylcobinamide-phosphate guanylyltransferase [Campylobacterota bacterium]|nr:bifunctional adenosylcobinamide kinase/adenosylcobinamide-phosphate guanylyltransferase [Campylobacterota bacterium]